MEDNKKIPNGIYFRLLTEIAPKIYQVFLDKEYSKDLYHPHGNNPEFLAAMSVYHAKALINEIYKNRFND